MAIGNQVIGAIEYGVFTGRRTLIAEDPPKVMLMLGDFEFSIDTVAYNELSRDASWRWNAQERIGKQSLMQYTGKESRSVKLSGEAHTLFRNGVGAIDDLYDIGDNAEPLLLVSGAGDVLGWWVITEFSDTVPSFLPGGVPRRKTFSVTIKHYADDISNP